MHAVSGVCWNRGMRSSAVQSGSGRCQTGFLLCGAISDHLLLDSPLLKYATKTPTKPTKKTQTKNLFCVRGAWSCVCVYCHTLPMHAARPEHQPCQNIQLFWEGSAAPCACPTGYAVPPSARHHGAGASPSSGLGNSLFRTSVARKAEKAGADVPVGTAAPSPWHGQELLPWHCCLQAPAPELLTPRTCWTPPQTSTAPCSQPDPCPFHRWSWAAELLRALDSLKWCLLSVLSSTLPSVCSVCPLMGSSAWKWDGRDMRG